MMTDYLRLAREAQKRVQADAPPGEPQRKNEFNEVSPSVSAEPRIEVSPEKLEAFAPAIAEFQKAGFEITRVRGGAAEPRGISMEQWRMREIARQCDEYLKSLPPKPALTSKPKRGKPPEGIQAVQWGIVLTARRRTEDERLGSA
jgi:hypothetical protein